MSRITGAVRVIDTVDLKKVILIGVDENNHSAPFSFDFQEWLDLLHSDSVMKTADPYLMLSSIPKSLPIGATVRYKQVLEITSKLSMTPNLLHTRKALTTEINAIAKAMRLNSRTIKRWVFEWLKAGRNPVAAVRKFLPKDENKVIIPQKQGKKRGVSRRIGASASLAPAHEVTGNISKAYDMYVMQRRMTWRDAYHEMLIALYGIPEEAMSEQKHGLFLDRVLVEKYRVPTWTQFRYRCRCLKNEVTNQGTELPQGKRGKAADDVFGPGFFEIDATHFQIQLVSRLTKAQLVGKPTVYLIVDIFSGAITGYCVSLENPSWAVAAQALFNCFNDKGFVFKRLGLPYESKDWPCRQLPIFLRADRAELVSNMGQAFPSSGIRVEIAPSMTPEAKGTIEGKNAEIKKSQRGRFDLPGRYEKIRRRRSPDGKKTAALDIFEFERILVEIIMDINREPIAARRIPPDALLCGAKVASRIGFYEWGLEHRAGYTLTMGPNFAYEHLLTRVNAPVTPQGIHVKGEIFSCDRLRELGILITSVDNNVKISAAYNPLFASEIYFHDQKNGLWPRAFNVDPEIARLKASFAETANYRAMQNLLTEQAGLNSHAKRRQRIPVVRKIIQVAIQEKKTVNIKTSGAKAQIRENRAQERANERSPGLNGAISSAPPFPASDKKNNLASDAKTGVVRPDNVPETIAESNTMSKTKSLWEKVNAVNKH
ncbi:integrase core domain protein [Collimonas arenae]|uniref:Integrase core domain protein n=2 Tax=Collimonas arenae TaxID=279058 RepID=A0A127QDX2_9BURK|nr:integrase core domain protein [Collimonas arenae]